MDPGAHPTLRAASRMLHPRERLAAASIAPTSGLMLRRGRHARAPRGDSKSLVTMAVLCSSSATPQCLASVRDLGRKADVKVNAIRTPHACAAVPGSGSRWLPATERRLAMQPAILTPAIRAPRLSQLTRLERDAYMNRGGDLDMTFGYPDDLAPGWFGNYLVRPQADFLRIARGSGLRCSSSRPARWRLPSPRARWSSRAMR